MELIANILQLSDDQKETIGLSGFDLRHTVGSIFKSIIVRSAPGKGSIPSSSVQHVGATGDIVADILVNRNFKNHHDADGGSQMMKSQQQV